MHESVDDLFLLWGGTALIQLVKVKDGVDALAVDEMLGDTARHGALVGVVVSQKRAAVGAAAQGKY